MKKSVLALILTLLMALAVFAGCAAPAAPAAPAEPAAPEAPAEPEKPAEPAAPADSEIEAIKKAGKLVVLTNAAFPPYEFIGKDNKPAGVDMDVCQVIADKLGVELVVEDMEFDSIIAALVSGKGNIGASGFSITEERLQQVDFSIEYAKSSQVIVVKEGSDIKSSADLAGKSIGVQQGTTGMYYAEEVEGATVENYPSAMNAAIALMSDKIDCVIVDNMPAEYIAKNNEGLVVLDEILTTETYGLAINKNSDLTAFVNDVVKGLIDDGSIDKFTLEETIASGEAAN